MLCPAFSDFEFMNWSAEGGSGEVCYSALFSAVACYLPLLLVYCFTFSSGLCHVEKLSFSLLTLII